MALTAECPMCKDGRHERCLGQPLSEEQVSFPGMWRDCSCANRDHLTVNQWIEKQAVIRAGAPVLPYAGTSGYSGSDTSEERARTEDADGTTSERQRITLLHLNRFQKTGVTVKELRGHTGWHHGRASAVLSVLHKEGLIERLSERRERCKVYVVPEYVGGRETEEHGRKANSDTHKVAAIRAVLENPGVGHPFTDIERIKRILEDEE